VQLLVKYKVMDDDDCPSGRASVPGAEGCGPDFWQYAGTCGQSVGLADIGAIGKCPIQLSTPYPFKVIRARISPVILR